MAWLGLRDFEPDIQCASLCALPLGSLQQEKAADTQYDPQPMKDFTAFLRWHYPGRG